MMFGGGFNAEPGVASFQIVITVSVKNADALWDAALRRHLRTAEDLQIDEIMESIGPREDPSIEDCLETIALSAGLEGCSISDIGIRSAPLAADPFHIVVPERINLPGITLPGPHDPALR